MKQVDLTQDAEFSVDQESHSGHLPTETIETILRRIAAELQISLNSVRHTVQLMVEGSTVPFVARYRKEMTGGLDEVQISNTWDRYESLCGLELRRCFIRDTIKDQGKLTSELSEAISLAPDLARLEDLYLPFKPRRRTRAQKAREAGLDVLAQGILAGDRSMLAMDNLGELTCKDYPTVDAVLEGAKDIIAEQVSESIPVRDAYRTSLRTSGTISAVYSREDDPTGKYDSFRGLREPVTGLAGHRILGLNRGEREGVIRVDLGCDPTQAIQVAEQQFAANLTERCRTLVTEATNDAFSRLIRPSLESELRREMTEFAEDEAIAVFSTNLRALLMTPPLGEHAVIGIDPGFRSGCKVALIDPTGQLVETGTIFPHPPQNRTGDAANWLLGLLEHFREEFPIRYVAYGNGTGSRETGNFLAYINDLLEEREQEPIEANQVSESGASVYSASAVAREEFPDLDLTLRGAISIARRLQDPLAELIKTDPKAIGIGQYQHDVDQKKLGQALDRVVESCVNLVGVDLNTASAKLLSFVSGINERVAHAIVEHRNEIGRFTSRKQLLDVPGLGAKTFELCAGFLRIRGGENLLDSTAVHPERYELVGKICRRAGITLPELIERPAALGLVVPAEFVDEAAGVGLPTIIDIFQEIRKPGRDPRGKFEPFSYAEGVSEVTDLKPGMVVPGIVTNVTKFGCFVDVGVHQDGLVHISQISGSYIREPADVVAVGQVVKVMVMQVEPDRNRIALSIKQAAKD